MNRLVAALLLVLYIGTATELPQLAKVPMLVLHFLEHAERDHPTLGEFLHEHYMRGDVYDADRARDLQLPFKVELPGAWSIAASVPPQPSADLHQFASPLERSFLRDIPLLAGIKTSIWHPPAA